MRDTERFFYTIIGFIPKESSRLSVYFGKLLFPELISEKQILVVYDFYVSMVSWLLIWRPFLASRLNFLDFLFKFSLLVSLFLLYLYSEASLDTQFWTF